MGTNENGRIFTAEQIEENLNNIRIHEILDWAKVMEELTEDSIKKTPNENQEGNAIDYERERGDE